MTGKGAVDCGVAGRTRRTLVKAVLKSERQLSCNFFIRPLTGRTKALTQLAVKASLKADQRFKPVITSITNPTVKNVIVAGILRRFRCDHHFTALRTGGPPKVSFVQIAHGNARIEAHDNPSASYHRALDSDGPSR